LPTRRYEPIIPPVSRRKDAAAVSLGRRGGKKRWAGKSARERSAHGKMMRAAGIAKARKRLEAEAEVA